MQLLTQHEISTLKMTESAMIDATETLIDWGTIVLGSSVNLGIQVHKVFTSDRAISGYKAIYSILMIILLCCQYAIIWVSDQFSDPRKKPPIVGELVSAVKKSEIVPDPWQTELTVSLIPGKGEEIAEPSPVIGFLPPATSPAPKTRKTRTKKAGSPSTAPKTARKPRAKKTEGVVA